VKGARVEALRRAMGWLDEHAREILAPRPTWLLGVKRLAEAAMLADILLEEDLGRRDPVLEEHATGWLEACWRLLRGGDFLVECVERDGVWVGLAMAYVPFHKRGMRNPRFEAVLEARADRVEADWFVELAVACAFEHLALRPRRDIASLARSAWITRATRYMAIDPARAYETTHLVFWLEPLGRVTPALRDRLLDWTPRWVEHYRAVRNVDVVAELIMMSHVLGAPCAAADTWSWLLDRQEADGAFPGVGSSAPVLGRFHTTAVAAMALALCLGDRRC
jgi:hypothetical protein